MTNPLFTKQEEQDHAENWLNQAPETGFLDIALSPETLTINITQEAKELLKHLKDQGIEYEAPVLVLCG
jgi:phosphosulfolactate synthase (CoM biosynthesis protein A)